MDSDNMIEGGGRRGREEKTWSLDKASVSGHGEKKGNATTGNPLKLSPIIVTLDSTN